MLATFEWRRAGGSSVLFRLGATPDVPLIMSIIALLFSKEQHHTFVRSLSTLLLA
jgi:hypothetical protein